MLKWNSLLFLIVLSSSSWVFADPPPLIQRINDDHAMGTDLWIYNDISAAKKEAKKVNKPLFVTFRCVPCRDCKGFDAEVAQGSATIAKLAKAEFIPIRQVEMKGVDLIQFQFDYDLNWAAMFINADGTVYARYGTQSSEGADAYNSIEGLENTMKRVLELHKNYEKHKASLQAKRGKDREYSTALEMPGMEKTATLKGLTERTNCVHCHMLHDAENRDAINKKTFTNALLWRYPLPQNLGLEIVRDHGTQIQSIASETPAAKAKLTVGEEIVSMNGQPMTSIADMQWVLHNLSNNGATLKITGSKSGESTLKLPPGWKVTDASWRGSMWSVSPRLRVWAPALEKSKLKQLELPDGHGAYEVKWINRQQPGGNAAQKAGLKHGDVIVAAEGKPLPLDQRQWHYEMKLSRKIGGILTVTILRNGKRKQIEIPIVE